MNDLFAQAMEHWKRGKATGPDKVSQEALMRLAQDDESCRTGKTTSDLILILRKLAVRGSKEWKLPLHIVKLTIGRITQQRVGNADTPWEARLWLHVVQSDALSVELGQDTIRLRQTNGVRQGSPDSPVRFARAVGESLNAVLDRNNQESGCNNANAQTGKRITMLTEVPCFHITVAYMSGLIPDPPSGLPDKS